MVGDRSRAMWSRTAIFLADLTGMEINVPSGLKNWSICSVMRISINVERELDLDFYVHGRAKGLNSGNSLTDGRDLWHVQLKQHC